jgi:hypothetical protein
VNILKSEAYYAKREHSYIIPFNEFSSLTLAQWLVV